MQNSTHKCPACSGANVMIIDSRPLASSLADEAAPIIRRRRKCLDCPHRWSTYEMPADVFEQLRAALDRFSFLRPNSHQAAALD